MMMKIYTIKQKRFIMMYFFFYQDIQAEAPSHLLRLRVETERRLVMAILQECRVELKKEDKGLLTAGSERMIKEHRVRQNR